MCPIFDHAARFLIFLAYFIVISFLLNWPVDIQISQVFTILLGLFTAYYITIDKYLFDSFYLVILYATIRFIFISTFLSNFNETGVIFSIIFEFICFHNFHLFLYNIIINSNFELL